MKKILSFALSVILIFSMSLTVFAAEPSNFNSTDYQEYVQLVNDGILGEDITFEHWQSLKVQSAKLEKILENSPKFLAVYDSTSRESEYSMKAGDVFITNGTSCFGFTGHAGIAISSTSILHISGPGENPSTISLSNWNASYTEKGWTKVYRHHNSDVAKAAAKWADSTYTGSNAMYSINLDLASTDKTYCSKLVWQAYYYGPDSPCANGPTFGVRLPYDLTTTIHDLSWVETYEQT